MTTTSEFILYHAKRLLSAEENYNEKPTNKTLKTLESRRKEFNEAISKLSIKQGQLFDK
jgi:hypothetical protein